MRRAANMGKQVQLSMKMGSPCWSNPDAKKGAADAAVDTHRRSRETEQGESQKRGDVNKRRPSVEAVANRLSDLSNPNLAELAKDQPTLLQGNPLTKKNIQPGLLVVRGPSWKWADSDGGAGKPGTVACFDKQTETVTVAWHQTGAVGSFYRLGGSARMGDLCIASCVQDVAPPNGVRKTASAMLDALRKRLSIRCSSKVKGGSAAVTEQHVAQPVVEHIPRAPRNSQRNFNARDQTVIIFDWDDTLFPTAYVRSDLELSLKVPLKDQNILEPLKAEVGDQLAQCVKQVEQLLKLATSFGKVFIVTLARYPWVANSCSFFYHGMDAVLESLDVRVVYAQQGEQVDYNRVRMMQDMDAEMYWSQMKGKAIAKEVRKFYTQYPGQSWKNVISIGDSDFERVGTKCAMEEYMREQGVLDSSALAGRPAPQYGTTVEADVNGHHYKLRTKTFKMVDQPTVEELLLQLAMCKKWLPMMVNLDEGFDIDINDLEDPSRIKAIEEMLRGDQETDVPGEASNTSSDTSNPSFYEEDDDVPSGWSV